MKRKTKYTSKYDDVKPGEKFNHWTYLKKSKTPHYGYFRCDCGEIKERTIRSIVSGRSKSCGCVQRKLKNQETKSKYTNKRYERLLIKSLFLDNQNKWHANCLCDCGKTTTVRLNELLTGKTKSCGCLRSEKCKEYADFLKKESKKAHKKYGYKGTDVSSFNQKLSKNSSTGVKGVSQMKDGKFRAYIMINKKQKHLGLFDTIEDAAEARKKAEDRYFGEILEEWQDEQNQN